MVQIETSVNAATRIKQGKTCPLTTKQRMSGLVKPQWADLGDAMKTAPTDHKGCEALATRAALLNKVSYILMDDGQCPDAD